MKTILVVPLLSLAWLFVCGFSSIGTPLLPAGPAGRAFDVGLSISGQAVACFSCATNTDEGCYLLGIQAFAGLRLHPGGQLRLKFSAELGAAARQTEGDHSDHAGNVFLSPGVEYMLSLSGGRVAMLAGTELGLWRRNNRDEFEALSLTPYVGGIFALRDPGLARPYFSVRLGASVTPRRMFVGNLGAGVEIPIGGHTRLVAEANAGVLPGEDGMVPAAGAMLGLVF